MWLYYFPPADHRNHCGYVEDFTDTSGKVQVKYPEPLIQKGDVLSIVVYSDAIDEGKTDAMYNLANTGTGEVVHPRIPCRHGW